MCCKYVLNTVLFLIFVLIILGVLTATSIHAPSEMGENAILSWHEMSLLGVWPSNSETLLPLQREVYPLHHGALNVVCFLTLNVRL